MEWWWWVSATDGLTARTRNVLQRWWFPDGSRRPAPPMTRAEVVARLDGLSDALLLTVPMLGPVTLRELRGWTGAEVVTRLDGLSDALLLTVPGLGPRTLRELRGWPGAEGGPSVSFCAWGVPMGRGREG